MPPQGNLRENVDGNKLDLSMSSLVDVPVKEIAAIKKATHLDLSNNEITHLPPSFGSLTHLIELDLSKNMIVELPDSFGDLVCLKRLDLYGNQLSHLPLSFSRLKALKWLDLKNNCLVPKLAEIAGPCGDQLQCQQCARNVVAALTSTALQVEEERKKILEVRLREQEIIEEELKRQEDLENQGKKNKKKTKKPKIDKPMQDSHADISRNHEGIKNKKYTSATESKPSLTHKKQGEKQIDKGGGFIDLFQKLLYIFFWFGVLIFTIFIGTVLLAVYDRKLFQETITEWNVLSNQSSTIVLKSAKHVEYAFKHPFVREMRLQLIACFRSIIASILNIYKTICQEFPVYYDTVKNKFS